MSDLISRQAAIKALLNELAMKPDWDDGLNRYDVEAILGRLPSVQPDNRLSKISDLMEGTIDHFDLDDAMDLLYQIKEVLKNG